MQSPRLALTRTYLAPSADEAPGGGELPGVADVSPPREVRGEETHYDTADLALAAAGASVRRQTGDAPRGWVLELPGRGPRTHQVRHALGRAVRTAPAALQRLTWAAARGRTLGPVLQLTADATQRDLLDADGAVVARLTTRRVQARPLVPEDSAVQAWAEWQVEVVDGRRDLLDAVTAAWEQRGAEESDRTEQLRTVLDGQEETEDGDGAGLDDRSAGAPVLGQLAHDVSRLLAQDPLARIDAPGAVHALRGASRRLTGVLRSFAPLFADEPREALLGELEWLTGVLAAARDAEVLTERLLADLDEEATGHVAGSGLGDPAAVAESVRALMGERHGAAQAEVVAALDSERYRSLVAALEAFVAAPPLTREASRSARKALLPLAADAHRAVKDAQRDVDPDGEDADVPAGDPAADPLVRLRRAAEDARAAAGALVPLRGDDVEEYADALKELTAVLVEHEQAVAARAVLEELVPAAGQGAFVLGRVHALEEVRSAVARHDLDGAWDAANRKKLRKWMS
ncbi:CYTH and CHAD domain-containing protein [Paenibacillus sp. TRM 82003]|uniref:CYTH and CHAD domain-containing protein n=1 Tax=Kineococcus sp. TRM81007 TaxID=2925831 RepID=UPI001F5A3CC6|nr:CYTH and CHAD domain-containing protein [Kineococcus sp. TRM81007]MCI2239420.1 CYTH and CHAD domain-containing protein [Kineococcus sp. TRM81007]MCI3918790.1 CYTH and CHAD domain-containing protein [Paenibacillus sp. TRM 82003]